MHIQLLDLRKRDSSTVTYASPTNLIVYDSKCSSSSWFKLCPIDIIVWVSIIIIVSIVFWKVYATNRVGPDKISYSHIQGVKRKRSSYNLPFPYSSTYSAHSDQLPEYEDSLSRKGEQSPTRLDPYHVITTLDDSLISKDENFSGTSVPKPVLDQKKAGVGLGIDMNRMNHVASPISIYSEKVQNDSWKDIDTATQTPPPVYLRETRGIA